MKQDLEIHKASSLRKSSQSISIIIPTLNEKAYLPALLDALIKQTRQVDEIIIADAGSTDGTVELAKSRSVRVIPGGNPAVGRNAGARETKGDYLLFLDADVLPPPNFIAQFVEEFERKDCDIATCFISALEGKPLDRVICNVTNLYFWMIQPVSPHAPGFCILSKRTKHEALGGFDETLILSEDIDYARRAKRVGRFGIITSARIPVSMRRIGKEGLIVLGLKYALCEIYAFAGKPLRKPPFPYEYGKYVDDQASWHRSRIRRVSFHQPLLKVSEIFRWVGNLIRG
ncbi:MAG TPA: glycosyltransferase [Anaerolineaceae bacterium]|nr:glycosyltransferase [Anaerolineaceae bacterium]